MKIKSILKYLFHDYRNTVLIMYLCVYLFMILFSVSNTRTNTITLSGNVISTGISGVEIASIITLFVIALNSYKPCIKMFSTNGVSRKTVFCSVLTGMGITSVAMALIDTLNTLLFSRFMEYNSIFSLIYQSWFNGSITSGAQTVSYTFPLLSHQFLWLVFAYVWCCTVGFFITALYYRMNKSTNIAVSIGVPVSLFYVLPLLDEYFLNGALSRAVMSFVSFAWGLSNGCNPYIGMASMFVFAAINATLGWILMRRANVKA